MSGPGSEAAREDKTDAALGGALRAAGLIDSEGLESAKQFQKLHGGLLGDAVLRLELCREADFLRVFAEIYSTRFVKADKLATLKLEDTVLERVPVRDCERLRTCPFRWDQARGELHVVSAAPLAADLSQELRRITGAKAVLTYIATAGAVSALIRRWHYSERTAFQELTPNGAGPLPSLPKPDLPDEHSANTQTQGSLDAMLKTLRRENARLKIAQEFSRRVTLERNQAAMIDRILDVLFELLPAETAAISLDNGQYKARVRKSGLVADVPRSILEKTLQSESGILVNNALIDQRFGRSESVMIRGIKSVMAVPLKARDQTLGVLYVDSVSQSAAFNDEDLPLLASIAGQAAMFLDNANLIADVEREVERRTNLARFLSPAAVEEVMAGRSQLKLDGQAALVTVLFADIRGFTRLSADLRPEEVVQFLNRFFAAAVEAVESHGGLVDKFLGDCVMALWGATEPRPADARNALLAAADMVARSNTIDAGGRPLEIGVGVHSGLAVVGSIGSGRRLDYTAIGSTVNLASRLCSLAKPREVLCLEETLGLAGEDVVAQPTQRTTVKGYDQPVLPYLIRAVGGVAIAPPHLTPVPGPLQAASLPAPPLRPFPRVPMTGTPKTQPGLPPASVVGQVPPDERTPVPPSDAESG